MKLFESADLKKQLKNIYLGEVEAGQQKELKVYMLNDGESAFKELKYSFPKLPKTELLEIIDPPVFIDPHQAKALVIKWKPSLNFKKALELTLEITGKEIYVAKREE